MYTVYILKSEKDGKLYIGQTSNLAKRLHYHMSGRVRSTKNRLPVQLVHEEHFTTRSEAMTRERQIKSIGMKEFKDKFRLQQAVG